MTWADMLEWSLLAAARGLLADMHACPERKDMDESRDLVMAIPDPREMIQGCKGVPDPAGVFPPGVADSVPVFFFFFFFLGINAGGLVTALRRDR